MASGRSETNSTPPLREVDGLVHAEEGPPRTWDDHYDVVVVGFGAAGAAAAIEAGRAGASVLVVDRFDGGGATKMSGGVVYAGGGTDLQEHAGYRDTVEEMHRYLELETAGVVSAETLRAFCESSRANLDWLRALGVPLPPSGKALKTSYPPDDCTLYFSGNEQAHPYSEAARPAPRGHRALGKGRTGNVLFEPLRAAAESGAVVRRRCRVERLVVDAAGVVLGVEIRDLSGRGAVARAHALVGFVATYLGMIHRGSATFFDRLATLIERRFGACRLVRARGGVVLATGGFVFNGELMREHAGRYAASSMRLGSAGDRGDGIFLGRSVGAALGEMDRCAAFRFINPPSALVSGVLVDQNGERICNEELYGAAIGEALAQPEHGGRGWLVLDSDLATAARRQIGSEAKALFQKWCGAINLFVNRRRAQSIAELEQRCGIPAGALERAIGRYNEDVSRGADATGKRAERLAAIHRAPFYAINVDLANVLFPTPTLTLGGVRTAGLTAAVVDDRGKAIPGLYAAGRAAVGVSSRSYVSGLSLADCLFSGRNAGASAALRAQRFARVTKLAVSLSSRLERGLRVASA